MDAKQFSDLLIAEGLVPRDKMEAALQRQRRLGGRLGTNLMELGLIDEASLAPVLGRLSALPVYSGEGHPTAAALRLLSAQEAERFRMIPWRIEAGRLDVIVTDDCDPSRIENLEARFSLQRHYQVSMDTRLADLAKKLMPEALAAGALSGGDEGWAQLNDEWDFAVDVGDVDAREDLRSTLGVRYAPESGKGAAAGPVAPRGEEAPPAAAIMSKPRKLKSAVKTLSLAELTAAIAVAANQDEVVLAFASYGLGIAERFVYFGLQRNQLQVLVEARRGERVQPGDGFTVSLREQSDIAQVCSGESYYHGPADGPELTEVYRHLVAVPPSDVLVMPVKLGGKVRGLALIEGASETTLKDLTPVFRAVYKVAEALERVQREARVSMPLGDFGDGEGRNGYTSGFGRRGESGLGRRLASAPSEESGFGRRAGSGLQPSDESGFGRRAGSGLQRGDESGLGLRTASGLQRRDASGLGRRPSSGLQRGDESALGLRTASGLQRRDASGFGGRAGSGLQGGNESGLGQRAESGLRGGFTSGFGQRSAPDEVAPVAAAVPDALGAHAVSAPSSPEPEDMRPPAVAVARREVTRPRTLPEAFMEALPVSMAADETQDRALHEAKGGLASVAYGGVFVSEDALEELDLLDDIELVPAEEDVLVAGSGVPRGEDSMPPSDIAFSDPNANLPFWVTKLDSSDPDLATRAWEIMSRPSALAVAALMARFPGRLRLDRFHYERDMPPASRHSLVLAALVAQGTLAVEALAGMLESQSVEERFYALLTLAEIRTDRFLGRIWPFVFDKDRQVRLVALRILRSRVRSPDYPEILRLIKEVAEEEDERRIDLAIAALGELRDFDSLDVVIRHVEHPNRRLAEAAQVAAMAIALGDGGPGVKRWERWLRENEGQSRIQRIADAMMDKERAVRVFAAEELGEIPGLMVNYHPDAHKRERQRARQVLLDWYGAHPEYANRSNLGASSLGHTLRGLRERD